MERFRAAFFCLFHRPNIVVYIRVYGQSIFIFYFFKTEIVPIKSAK